MDHLLNGQVISSREYPTLDIWLLTLENVLRIMLIVPVGNI